MLLGLVMPVKTYSQSLYIDFEEKLGFLPSIPPEMDSYGDKWTQILPVMGIFLDDVALGDGYFGASFEYDIINNLRATAYYDVDPEYWMNLYIELDLELDMGLENSDERATFLPELVLIPNFYLYPLPYFYEIELGVETYIELPLPLRYSWDDYAVFPMTFIPYMFNTLYLSKEIALKLDIEARIVFDGGVEIDDSTEVDNDDFSLRLDVPFKGVFSLSDVFEIEIGMKYRLRDLYVIYEGIGTTDYQRHYFIPSVDMSFTPNKRFKLYAYIETLMRLDANYIDLLVDIEAVIRLNKKMDLILYIEPLDDLPIIEFLPSVLYVGAMTTIELYVLPNRDFEFAVNIYAGNEYIEKDDVEGEYYTEYHFGLGFWMRWYPPFIND